MTRLGETIGGIWELVRFGWRTRFRFRGPYWAWRMETAFGRDAAKRPRWRRRAVAILAYGRWVHRLRRFT
jgi:hypothetical protein